MISDDEILTVPANVVDEIKIDYPTEIDRHIKITQLHPSERVRALDVFLDRCLNMLKKIRGSMSDAEEAYIRQNIMDFIVKRGTVSKIVLSKAVKDEGEDIYDIAFIKQSVFKRVDTHRMFTLTMVKEKT